VRCSDVFDQFPGLTKWLEDISNSKSSRILINEEGLYSELSSYNVGLDKIRVIVYLYRAYACENIDFVVDKKLFVKLLYSQLLSFAQD
jgi:hypothetical protein